MSNIVDPHSALDALGDPTRRQIVERLRHGPLPVGDLAAALPVGRPAVSKHLRVLADAGLVRHTAVGTRHLYSLAPAGPDAVRSWLAAQWGGVLEAFADHVEHTEHRSQP
ncbi:MULTISPECIES: helix-turn-helix transcriptional regulator [unclassified Isoptericola]|uniref:ArsR/SmtB family transcription factor n=1 Tax=unclassified Isoptericola TaxID=2623355 RepID=UPI0027133C4C|nr:MULTISPECIES: metalloregulator ArsR/SmtB family transcription factor [unclassified Isoptericola]MDO8144815.1 metalloregulator ArsR/SmtB family transcription factor [Isoptericola sp. 178]MDO8149595.1 metalloregulator ArsR/SmtB family transcription factor [Isoptericola sp. b515]MDO8152529.1 metalloregulator ArsR/SmtB family transcription factor [Isoptericola sp. b408]